MILFEGEHNLKCDLHLYSPLECEKVKNANGAKKKNKIK